IDARYRRAAPPHPKAGDPVSARLTASPKRRSRTSGRSAYSRLPMRYTARSAPLCAALMPLVLLLAACGGGAAPAKPADPAADALARGIAAHNANKLDEATKDYFEVLFNDPKNKFA